MTHHVALGEVEEGIVLQQRVLKVIALDRIDLYIGTNAAAAVNRASAVGEFHFAIRVVAGVGLAIVIVVVERDVAVVALDQPSAGRVVVSRGQRQAGVLRQRIYRLNQALAEGDFTHDQTAIMILNRSRNNFCRGSGQGDSPTPREDNPCRRCRAAPHNASQPMRGRGAKR